MTTVSPARRRRGLLLVIAILAIQVLLASPASAASSCVPNPERPTAGFVATIDPPRPEHGTPDHPYGHYAYAGTRWNTYSDSPLDLFCGNPFAHTDTWLGNQFFNVGKTVVAANNSLWYLLTYSGQNGPVFSNIDHGLSTGAKSLYDNAFTPLLSLVLLLAVVWILFKTLKGALAHVATKLLWILFAFWVAASSYLMPGAYTTFLDSILTDGIREIQGAVLAANGYDSVNGMPQLLYDQVISKTWLEGEFSSATSPIALQQGPRLLDSQAWSKSDSVDTVSQADLDRKKATFEDVAAKVRGTEAEAYFTGDNGSRFGTGFLGMVRGLCFAYFPLIAQLGQLLGMLILRLLILFAPILGLVMILYHRAAPGIARGLGKALGSCLMLAIGSTGYLWVLPIVLKDTTNSFLQMVIMAVITIIAMVLIRPFRQITSMVSGIVHAAGLNYATNSTATGWALRTWTRHRRRNKRDKRLLRAIGTDKQGAEPPTRQRHRPEAVPTPGRQNPPPPRRPEAAGPQRATSTRLPVQTARPHGPSPRAGLLGPRVFFQGPRVFHQGPATNTSTGSSTNDPSVGPSPAEVNSLPTVEIVPMQNLTTNEPHLPKPLSQNGVIEELVAPSEHDQQARRRAEGHDLDPPVSPRSIGDQQQPVVQIYHPSEDQIVPHPTETNPPINRPENDDRGDADADPI
jgi:hypothetical protein